MIEKKSNYKGISTSPVYIEDKSQLSPNYFPITWMPADFTGGKNLIKLKAHRTNLVKGSYIDIEILDSNGDSIYHEIPEYIDEYKSRSISVYIYPNTPSGPCLISIIGYSDFQLCDLRSLIPPLRLSRVPGS